MQLRIMTCLAALALLAGCGSSGNNVLGPIGQLGPGGNKAQVVFVNGSPDAGPVQVIIDNQQQFCTNAQTGSACAISYGQITASGQVALAAGTHAITLRDNSGNQITIPSFSGSFGVNAGSSYSIVLAGDVHPTYSSSPTLTLTTFQDEPFSSAPAVNIHQASPYAQSINGSGGIQFGYYNGTTPASNALGTPTAFGSETTPQSIPQTAQNAPITFYAISPTSGISAGPSIADATNCSGNSLPCTNVSNHLSLYLIDGPAASTTPVSVPAGMNPSAKAVFVGTFVP
jgi:hypothetical protein